MPESSAYFNKDKEYEGHRSLFRNHMSRMLRTISGLDLHTDTEHYNHYCESVKFLYDLINPYMNTRPETIYKPQEGADDMSNLHYMTQELLRVGMNAGLIPNETSSKYNAFINPEANSSFISTIDGIGEILSTLDVWTNTEHYNRYSENVKFLEDQIIRYTNRGIYSIYQPSKGCDDVSSLHLKTQEVMRIAMNAGIITPEIYIEDVGLFDLKNLAESKLKCPLTFDIYKKPVFENSNFSGLCVGGPGTGKSYNMAYYLSRLDSTFNDGRVAFSYPDFMENIEHRRRTQGILCDEAGVWISSRESMSKRNRKIGKIVQTIRNRNLFVVLTSPSYGMVDLQIRATLHFLFEMQGNSIDRQNETAQIDVFKVLVDQKSGETNLVTPKVWAAPDKVYFVPQIITHKPSQDWIDGYESRKRAFQKRIYVGDGSMKEDMVREKRGRKRKEVKMNGE